MSLPNEKDVRDLLAGLLGKQVALQPGDPVHTAAVDLFTVAVYATNGLKTVAVVAIDLPLSAYLGAGLAMMPAAGAKEAIEAKSLHEDLMENLHEVLNVGASMFNRKDAPHVKLYKVYAPGESLPGDVRGWLSQRGGRLDLAIDVPGYGTGGFTVVDTFL